MNAKNKEFITKYKTWYKENILVNHIANTKKLKDLKEFNVNPLTLNYISQFLEGNSDPVSLAKALVYPRVLGTSISTTFGTAIQKFITVVLGNHGSLVSGVDIEFIDTVDGRRKYCQLKAGPNNINKDDVDPIKAKFKAARNLARTNNKNVQPEDFTVCLIYGEDHEKNSFTRVLEQHHPVYAGQDFWLRLTGDKSFYSELIKASGELARDVNMKALVDETIQALAKQLK